MSIRVLEAHEYRKAAEVLFEAFSKDLIMPVYFADCDGNDEKQQQKIAMQIFDSLVYGHILEGMVLVAGDFEGIACWMPPGKDFTDWVVLRSGMWRLYYMLGSEGRKRFFSEFKPLVGNTKSEILQDRDLDSWYLGYLGTVEAARGKGYARKLIEYCTDIADKDGKACYIESTNDNNFAVYQKMGFVFAKDAVMKRGETPHRLHCMVREPVTKSDS